MIEDESCILVIIVVFELKVVGFFLAVGDVAWESTVAEGAGEEVALARWLAVLVAWYFAYGDLFWGCGINGGDEAGPEKQEESWEGRHD